MANQLFVNNVQLVIVQSLNNVQTSIQVANTDGLSTLTNGDYYIATIVPVGGLGSLEIIKITAVGNNVLTVVRAQEGTTAQHYLFGSLLEVRLTAGALTNLGTFTQEGTGAIKRTDQDKLREWVSPEDFGAIGDGVTDDSAAFQLALNECAGGKVLHISGKKYNIQHTLTTSGYLHMFGDGVSSAELLFVNNASLQYRGATPQTFPTHDVNIRNISFQAGDALNTSTAILDIQFASGGNGSTVRAVTLTDVEVCGVTLSNAFNGGIYLFNAPTFKITRARVCNANTGTGGYIPSSFGIRADTDSQSGDWYIDQTNVYFCEQGISGIGEATGQGFEGLTCTECLVIACLIGITVNSSAAHLYTRISGCNINCVQKDISIRNMIWIDITDNVLYPYDTGATVTTWNAIEIIYDDVNHGLNADNAIRGNIINGSTSTHATSKNGIVFDNNANGEESHTLIDANTLSNLDGGVVLFAGTTNVTTTDTNVFRQVTNPSSDSSGNVTNIFARANANFVGEQVSSFGIETKWGSNVTITLGTGAAGAIVFDTPFKHQGLIAVIQNGNPGGSGSTAVLSVINSSLNATGFGFFANGMTAGQTITVNYIAIGN